MYSMVLMMALSTGGTVPDCHRHSCGCYCSGYGGCYGGYGCHGGCYGGGCYGGGCYGGWGGCYGGCYGGYGGCYGGWCGGYAYPAGMGGTTTDGATDHSGGRGRTGDTDRNRNRDRNRDGGEEESFNAPLSATLIVSLPADAKLTVDGSATNSTSSLRRFTTPPLERGKVYYYALEAQVKVDGKVETIAKRVTVRAGQETYANLGLPVATASSR